MLYTHLFQLAVLGPPQPVTGHSIIPTLQTSIIDKLVTQVHNIPEIAKLCKSHQQDVEGNVKMDINLNLLAIFPWLYLFILYCRFNSNVAGPFSNLTKRLSSIPRLLYKAKYIFSYNKFNKAEKITLYIVKKIYL